MSPTTAWPWQRGCMPQKQGQARPEASRDDGLKQRELEEERQEILRPGRFDPGADKSGGKATRGQDEIATRRHLEGSEQGPS